MGVEQAADYRQSCVHDDVKELNVGEVHGVHDGDGTMSADSETAEEMSNDDITVTNMGENLAVHKGCLLYTSPSPRDS